MEVKLSSIITCIYLYYNSILVYRILICMKEC